MKLHKTAQSEIHRLKPTKSAEAIEQYAARLGASHSRRRGADAGQGDIFTPEISAEFRRLIGITMQGPDAAAHPREPAARRARSHCGHARERRLPAGCPLQSTPPSLLLNLPPLPPELEYRVVGHDLVLRDVDANLIVDFIPMRSPDPMRRASLLLIVLPDPPGLRARRELTLPLKPDSVRFAVIGDSGTGRTGAVRNGGRDGRAATARFHSIS